MMKQKKNIHSNIFKSLIYNNRGIALFVSIALVSIMVPVVIEANKNAFRTVESMATTRHRHSATYIAKFGIRIAMNILIEDAPNTSPDSLRNICEDPEFIAEILTEIGSQFEVPKSLSIKDELGKLQINALIKPPNTLDPDQELLWDRALRTCVEKHGDENQINETRSIIQSVADWLDENDDERPSGAEKSYYESMDIPKKCRNGFFKSIDELFDVKGFTSSIADCIQYRNNATIYGAQISKDKINYTGLINIRSADVPVLTLLFPEEDLDRFEKAQIIHSYRLEKEDENFKNSIDNNDWYVMALNEEGYGAENALKKIIMPADQMKTVGYFRIVSTATKSGITKTISAVVKREKVKNKWRCIILTWEDVS